MAYEPKINVLDSRQIDENILTYLRETQTNALLWANNDVELPSIKDFFNSERIVTRFPSLQIVNGQHATEFNDVLAIPFAKVFEIAIQDGNADYLSQVSKKYSMAIESMLANCSKTTFNENSIIEYQVSIVTLETEFDKLKKGKGGFVQVFQTRAVWELKASAYNQ